MLKKFSILKSIKLLFIYIINSACKIFAYDSKKLIEMFQDIFGIVYNYAIIHFHCLRKTHSVVGILW